MALTFPVLVRHERGACVAETPALPGWSASAPSLDGVLASAREALATALLHNLEAIGYGVKPVPGVAVHEVSIEEPLVWWDKDPSE